MEFITDRTDEDVEQARQTRAEIIQQLKTPNANQQKILDRGFFDKRWILRVMGNADALETTLKNHGYYNFYKSSGSKQTSYEIMEKFAMLGQHPFTKYDFYDIINLSKGMRESTPIAGGAADIEPVYTWETFNKIEQNFSDVNTAIEELTANVPQCGVATCGEER